MTVTEYVTKFTELARFAPTIVPTDNARKRKFMLGLRVEVAKQIDGGSHGPRSYADAVQRALGNKSWDRIVSRPGLVFQRAATMIKYYYYFYANFTSEFFFDLQ